MSVHNRAGGAVRPKRALARMQVAPALMRQPGIATPEKRKVNMRQVSMNFCVTARAHTCEQCSITFATSGLQGGDTGNGGWGLLKIDMGELEQRITHIKNGVEIVCTGDWEIEGLISALVRMGKVLEKKYPEATTRWPGETR